MCERCLLDLLLDWISFVLNGKPNYFFSENEKLVKNTFRLKIYKVSPYWGKPGNNLRNDDWKHDAYEEEEDAKQDQEDGNDDTDANHDISRPTSASK